MAQNVDVTITETTVAVEVTLSPEVLAKIEAAEAAASASAAATSASNAATSESNAQTSANNAATSENNAADDASDAEKHAQEIAPFTDSNAVNFDKGAKGYKEDAEAARDEITDKFTFTDYSDGDLARFDGTKFQPITQQDLFNQNLYRHSPLTSIIDNPTTWDLNPMTSTTTANGNNYTIIGGWKYLDVNFNFSVGDAVIFWIAASDLFGKYVARRYYIDSNNWLEIRVERLRYQVWEKSAGLETKIVDTAFGNNDMAPLGSQQYLFYNGIRDSRTVNKLTLGDYIINWSAGAYDFQQTNKIGYYVGSAVIDKIVIQGVKTVTIL